jgi:hypothetical protein
MDGWMDGWMDVKDILRNAYSNTKVNIYLFVRIIKSYVDGCLVGYITCGNDCLLQKNENLTKIKTEEREKITLAS